MIFQENIFRKGGWLQHFGILTLLLFSLSSCQEEKVIVPENSSVTVEEFLDAVIADEHIQNTLTLISAGLDKKMDVVAIEQQLSILFKSEKTDYLRSTFEMIPVYGSTEEHAKAVFARLNERIADEFGTVIFNSADSGFTIGLQQKATPCFDRLTSDRMSIQSTLLTCVSGAVVTGNYDAAWGCEALAVVQLVTAYDRFHRCLRNNY